MQTQVVHQRKASIPWIPMLVAALLVAATALSLQLAVRDRGTTIAPSVSTVDQGANLDAAATQGGVDPTTAAREGRGFGVAYLGAAASGAVSGPHPRTKFGGSATAASDPRGEALKLTITRIEQAR